MIVTSVCGTKRMLKNCHPNLLMYNLFNSNGNEYESCLNRDEDEHERYSKLKLIVLMPKMVICK